VQIRPLPSLPATHPGVKHPILGARNQCIAPDPSQRTSFLRAQSCFTQP
jgi:hypothetical protein